MIGLLLFVMAAFTVSPSPGNRFTLGVEKTGLMKGKKHLFSFSKYSGNLQYDTKSAAASKVDFTLDGASMICEDDWVKESDRQKIMQWGLGKMIQVEKHPTIHFESTKVTQTDATHFQISGALTMRGVSHPAVVTVIKEGLTLDGSSTVDMREWGMKPPSAGLGTVGTKPDMLVQFHLTFR